MSRLDRRAWSELPDPCGLLVIPLGATEQHGPHLPLGTDTAIALALADGLAARVPGVLVAPPLAYGSSGEHQGFAGTLSVGRTALELVLVELVRSATETFSRILLLCAHGGNVGPVRSAVRRLRAERRDVRAWGPAMTWAGDAHAGRVETSLMLALAPHDVDERRAAPGNTRPLAELLPRLVSVGVRGVSPNGVLGDPGGATQEAGHRLLSAGVQALEDAVAAWPADDREWL